MAKRGSKARTGTVKTGQAEIDRQLDEQYAQTAVAWWDVRRPEVYFGIKGERTDEQKDLVRRFRQEWSGGTGAGARGGANAINAFIEGSVTSDQLSSNWGSENLQAIIKAGEFSSEAFQEGGNFGEYLRTQWENVSEFMGGTGIGPDGSLGSLSTSPSQIAGDKGRLSADDYAQQAYLDNIRAAAEQAGIAIDVEGPANSVYELNLGQYDDVPLGSYHTVREPDSIAEILFEAIIKTVVIGTLTGAIGAELQNLAETIGAAGDLKNLSTGLSIYETSDTATNVAAILDTIGVGLQGLNAASMSAGGGGLAGGTLSNVLQYAADIAPELSTTQGVLNGLDFIRNVYNSGPTQAALDEAENAGAPDSVITEVPEEEVVSLEADEDLMGTTEEVAVTQELPPEAEVFEGESTRVVDPIGEVGGTVTVTEVDSGDPFFQPETVPDTTPDDVEIEEVGYEVTEPEVDLELDPILPEQPTTEETGGGGASSQESTDAAQDPEVVTQDPEVVTQEPEATDLEEAIADAVEVTSEDTPATEDDSDIFSDAAEDDESTAVRPFFRIVNGQVFVRDTLGEDFNWVTYEDFTGSTPPDWLPEDDGLYGEHGEPLGEIEQQATGEQDAPPEDDSDDIVIDVLSGNSSDVLNVIIDDLTGETPDPVVTTEDPVVTTEDPVVTTEDPVDTTGTETDTEDGDTKVTDGEENGDDNNGNGDNGNGDDGDGGDGDDGGDEGDGGLGLSGGGLFSLEAPSIFEPSYKPLDYDTQLLKPRMFDFIDYNPLRNIR